MLLQGGTTGLADEECSGPCAVGHWCAAGSITDKAAECPAGRYGAVVGLSTPACSPDCRHGACPRPSVCAAGFLCPAGSIIASPRECGGAHVYCPAVRPVSFDDVDLSRPLPVAPGYYSTGVCLRVNHSNI